MLMTIFLDRFLMTSESVVLLALSMSCPSVGRVGSTAGACRGSISGSQVKSRKFKGQHDDGKQD